MKELSKTMQAVPWSAIRKIFDMCIGVDDLVKFTVGEPDFATQPNVIEAAHQAMLRGETKYTSNRGVIELRRAISEAARKKKNVDIDPETEVIVTNGGMQALFMSMKALLNPGDEIIIGAPYFTNYLSQVLMCDAVPKFVQLREEDGFIMTVDALRAAITDKTKAVLLNSPSNPLGSVIDRESLEGLAQVIKENNLYVITDEVYQDYIYDDDVKFCSIASLEGMKERSIIVDSCSKAFAMTGWRVGYAAGPAHIIDLMVKQQEGMASCVNAPAQYAALEAITNTEQAVSDMIQTFRRRRDLFVEGINNIDGLSCVKPKGAFYLFVNIKKTGLTSDEFAVRLLREAKVGVIPGSGFGDEGEGYVRISYVVSEDDIREGLKRIEGFVRSLGL
jgi:aminotransferase